jgi:hypothetical protein
MNTCWLAALLQSLLAMPNYREYFQTLSSEAAVLAAISAVAMSKNSANQAHQNHKVLTVVALYLCKASRNPSCLENLDVINKIGELCGRLSYRRSQYPVGSQMDPGEILLYGLEELLPGRFCVQETLTTTWCPILQWGVNSTGNLSQEQWDSYVQLSKGNPVTARGRSDLFPVVGLPAREAGGIFSKSSTALVGGGGNDVAEIQNRWLEELQSIMKCVSPLNVELLLKGLQLNEVRPSFLEEDRVWAVSVKAAIASFPEGDDKTALVTACDRILSGSTGGRPLLPTGLQQDFLTCLVGASLQLKTRRLAGLLDTTRVKWKIELCQEKWNISIGRSIPCYEEREVAVYQIKDRQLPPLSVPVPPSVGVKIDIHPSDPRIRAVISHSGSAYGGHYTCCVKIGGKWYFCDDVGATVREATPAEVEAKMALAYVYCFCNASPVGDGEPS